MPRPVREVLEKLEDKISDAVGKAKTQGDPGTQD